MPIFKTYFHSQTGHCLPNIEAFQSFYLVLTLLYFAEKHGHTKSWENLESKKRILNSIQGIKADSTDLKFVVSTTRPEKLVLILNNLENELHLYQFDYIRCLVKSSYCLKKPTVIE